MPDEKQKAVFARNFNRAMKNRGVRQIDIVNDLKINSSTVSNWSNGVMLPRSDKLKMLSEYLHVSEAFLMGWTVSDEKIGDVFYNDMRNDTKGKEPITTIAAHFDGDEYTEEELEEIRKFAEFVKSKRKDTE